MSRDVTPIPASRARRRRRSVVAVAGSTTSETAADRLLAMLTELGVQPTYLGREEDVGRIAAAVAEQRADAVDLCLGRHGGVVVVRNLLRELSRVGRRDVSIVIHRFG
jgi:hypothetical protein